MKLYIFYFSELQKRTIFGISKNVTFVFFFILFLAACRSSNRQNIQDYYYPLRDLKEAKVYEYRAVGDDSLPPYYWYFQTIRQDNGLFFTGNYYDQDFEVRQLTSEHVVKSGTLMQQYLLYQPDSSKFTQSVEADIEAASTFPFEVTDTNSVFLFKIKWHDLHDTTNTTTLVRNRRFKGFTKYTYQGKEYDCVEFAVRDLVDNFQPKLGHIEPQYSSREIYAKGIGLVFSSKELTVTNKIEYKLFDIYSMAVFEDKFSKKQ